MLGNVQEIVHCSRNETLLMILLTLSLCNIICLFICLRFFLETVQDFNWLLDYHCYLFSCFRARGKRLRVSKKQIKPAVLKKLIATQHTLHLFMVKLSTTSWQTGNDKLEPARLQTIPACHVSRQSQANSCYWINARVITATVNKPVVEKNEQKSCLSNSNQSLSSIYGKS